VIGPSYRSREELRIVEAYLEIEALRLGDRLKTELTVSESAAATLIPILSIQPLVENAVKHGIASKQGRGLVCVKAENVSAGLRITIRLAQLQARWHHRSREHDESSRVPGLLDIRAYARPILSARGRRPYTAGHSSGGERVPD